MNYAGGRRSGKTTEAIALAKSKGAILIVRDVNMAYNIRRLHPELKVMTCESFFNEGAAKGRSEKDIVIDDVDIFVKTAVHRVSRFNIAGIFMDLNHLLEIENK